MRRFAPHNQRIQHTSPVTNKFAPGLAADPQRIRTTKTDIINLKGCGRMKTIITLLVFTLCLSANTIQADEKVGVLLMHGKGGTSLPKSPIGPLIDFLESKRILVSAPDMPWSREREFDKTYEESMAEINEKVKESATSGKAGGLIVNRSKRF